MVTQLKKGDFEEGVKLEERWLTSDAPARSTKIAADTTFVDKTEGDIPITQAESIARKNVEAMGKVLEPVKDYIFDPVYKAWDVGGRRVVDKLNPLSKDFFKRRKEQSELYEKQKSQAFAAYREKREKTQDYLGLLADKYKTKADEVRATQGVKRGVHAGCEERRTSTMPETSGPRVPKTATTNAFLPIT